RPRWRSAGRRRSTPHPSSGRSEAEDGGGETFLPHEEWVKPRGRKSHRRRCGTGDRGADVLWPDQAIRGPVARAGPTALRRRRGGNRVTRTRGRPRGAKEKKPLRTEGRHCMSRPRPHSARMADRVASTETPPQCDRALRRRLWSRVGGDQRPVPWADRLHDAALAPYSRSDRERRGLSLDWPATSAGGGFPPAEMKSGCWRSRHARPSRGCHDDRARNCHCLSPTVGRYADVREAERGMISPRVTLLAISPT